MTTSTPSTARLVFERDGRTDEYVLHGDACTIGRGPGNDLALDRPTISRRHARLVRSGDGWRVEDRKSLKGTSLDGADGLERALRDGDVIRLGRFPVTFRNAVHRPAAQDANADWNAADDGSVMLSPAELADAPFNPSNTIVRPTVDFSMMLTGDERPTVERLERLLAVVTGVSRAMLLGDEELVFRRVLELVFEHLPADRACIMRWEPGTRRLRPVCERARRGAAPSAASPLPFSRTIAATVLRDRVAVWTTDAMSDRRFADGESVMELGIRSAMCAPLWDGDRVEGLISVDSSNSTGAFDRVDLDLLSALGNHLAVAIEQSRLQAAVVEEQLVRRRLARYHSPAVVERIVSRESDDAGLADEKQVTVLFADLVGFTARCERLAPAEIATWLNRCFEVMTEAVFRHEGMLDKFIGDGLMAVFGAPIAQPDHARRAMHAAVEMRDALRELERNSTAEPIHCRIGLHSGRVVAGDLGSRRRSDYTVLGATVNTASRIESTVAGADQIVVSQATLDEAGTGFETRPLGEHRLKGIDRALICHELCRGPES